ncbi:LCP family protein [Pseudolysinimonas kribbensis]|uniref:LCP family protein n=1 Tax=Pseudolysinimonas kribbensis TaxID=433641 RepID=UPI0024E0E0DE|nr:LCP family protein [Pseudolysinimonas kribbensis]
MAGVSVVAVAVGQLTTAVTTHTVHLAGPKPPPGLDAIKGEVNVLVVGTDTRKDQAGFEHELSASSGRGNNDVTILVHIAADHQSALVVSFPRDLMVPIPSCPNPAGGSYGASSIAMLNESLSRGGPACPVLTIEKLTGIDIPYAALVDFDGAATMADAVGGVTVCVATPIHDPNVGLDLPAGEDTISGDTARAFLRTRHGVGDGSDLGRISNQQIYLSALARTIKSQGVLNNPIKLFSIAKVATSSLQLSDSLGHLDTLAGIALAVKNIPLANIAMIQYPAGSSPLYPNRVVPVAGVDNLVNTALQQDQRVQLTGSTGRGAVLSPTQSAAPTSPPTSPPPSPSPSGAPAPVALPSTVQGQSADQQTCSKGVTVRG